jgi:membrane-associated phospholipid phosphatase
MEAAQKTLPSFIRQRLDPAQRYGLRLTLFAIAIVLVFVPFGFLLSQVIDEGPVTVYDRAVVEDLHEVVRANPWLIKPLQIVSFLGKPLWFYIVFPPVIAYLLWRRRMRLAVYLVATALVGGLIDTVVKVAVSRDRPVLEDPIATAFGQSFPSGHSFTSVALYGALLLVFMPVVVGLWRRVAITTYVVLVGSIAFSRLALGVHFLSDVLGGLVLGFAWLAASTAAFSIWRVERGRKPVKPERGLEPEAAKDLRPTGT